MKIRKQNPPKPNNKSPLKWVASVKKRQQQRIKALVKFCQMNVFYAENMNRHLIYELILVKSN